MPRDALVFYRTTGRLLRLSLRHTGQRSPLRKAASGQPWAVRFVRPRLKVHAQKLVSMVVGAGSPDISYFPWYFHHRALVQECCGYISELWI